MKRHPTENKLFCDGTFKEPDDNSKYTVVISWHKRVDRVTSDKSFPLIEIRLDYDTL